MTNVKVSSGGSAPSGPWTRIVSVQPRTLVLTVHCLLCGATYGKPEGRGTMKTNPGCPECGYLGWEPAVSASGSSASVTPLRRGSAPPPAGAMRLTPPK